ncbi:MAG: helix-hairpin-helix domain-containing protein [Pseudomonadota bacterium]|nr:helix-hairpin-helix domain-containing protein [Pseudomonadota bacterium]
MNLKSFAVGAVVALVQHAAGAATDVNRGSAQELESVKGLGPAMSRKIIHARRNGPFRDWHDLQQRVQGIGPGNSVKLSSQGLTVDGAAYAGAWPGRTATAVKARSPLPVLGKR